MPPRLLPPETSVALALGGATILRRLVVCVPLALGAAGLHAQSAMPPTAGVPDAFEAPAECSAPELLEQPANVLHEHLQRCERSATYLIRLGVLRNQQSRYEQAADHLERALMLEPDAPEALIQYAIALAGSGDVLSALHLMASLEHRANLPDSVRASLRSVVATWGARLETPIWASAPAVGPLAVTTVSVSTRMGYDSNLQGSSRLSSLTLTLPGEVVTLPIEPSQFPRSGTVLQSELRATHQRVLPHGARWGTQAAIQQRYTPGLVSAGSAQAEWQFDYTAAPFATGVSPPAPGLPVAEAPGTSAATWAPWGSASLAALHGRGGTRYVSRSLAVGVERASGGCAARWGVDGQDRHLGSNPILSGHYSGISFQWHCAGAPSGLQWLAVLRLGQDRAADASRPGGDQNQAGLRLHASAPAPALLPVAHGTPRWTVDAEYSRSNDTQGYSALLDNGRVRNMQRITARVEWRQPVLPGIQAVLGAESVVQNAKLPLFQMRSHGVWIGLRGQW